MHAIRSAALISAAIAISGCATAPSGSEAFTKATVPAPANDEVVLVVFRQVTPPTMGALTVQINGLLKAKLPNNSYILEKIKAGSTVITVTYPTISVVQPKTVETLFEGGSTHYLEVVGGLGQISMPGPYVQVWGGMVERGSDDAIRLLTQCCRRVAAAPL